MDMGASVAVEVSRNMAHDQVVIESAQGPVVASENVIWCRRSLTHMDYVFYLRQFY